MHRIYNERCWHWTVLAFRSKCCRHILSAWCFDGGNISSVREEWISLIFPDKVNIRALFIFFFSRKSALSTTNSWPTLQRSWTGLTGSVSTAEILKPVGHPRETDQSCTWNVNGYAAIKTSSCNRSFWTWLLIMKVTMSDMSTGAAMSMCRTLVRIFHSRAYHTKDR